MTRFDLVAIVCTALLFACGGEEGKPGAAGADGPPGPACTVKEVDGGATIECDDGSSTTIDSGACSVTSEGGEHEIECPDGSAVIRDGEQLARAQVIGEVSAFGIGPVDDVLVTLVEVDRKTTTDAEGRFAFDLVAPGLYTLRLSFEGHATLEKKNVPVFGGVVDTGKHQLKRGRALAPGLALPLSFVGESKALLLRTTELGFSGDLVIADLETREEELLVEEVGETTFESDRYVVSFRMAGAGVECFVYDVQTGESQWFHIDQMIEVLAGGLLYEKDDEIVFHPYLGQPNVLLGAAGPEDVSDDGSTVLIRFEDGSLRTIHSLSRAQGFIIPADASFGFDEIHGRVAFVEDVGGEDTLSFVLDPASGEVLRAGALPYVAEIFRFSADGTMLAFGDGTRVGTHDFESGETIADLGLAAESFELGPDGRWLLHGDGAGLHSLTLLADAETTFDVSGTDHDFSKDGRWLSWWTATSIRVLDLETRESTDFEGVDDVDFVEGTDWLVIESESGAVARDMSTGEEVEFGDDSFRVGKYIAFEEPTTGFLAFLDLDDGQVELTELVSDDYEIYVLGDRHVVLLDRLRAELFAVDAPTLSVLAIDENVFGIMIDEAGIWYVTSPIDPVGEELPPEFADSATLHWVVLP